MLARVAHDDPDASVRRTAVWALGQSDDGVDAATLAAVLRADADPEVREMAAWALGEADEKARGAEARAALADALRRDAGDEVRATAAWALGQSEGADVAALSAGAADRVAEVRKAALWALGQQGLKKAPAGAIGALKDGDAEVRLAAAWALGEIEDPAAGPALIAAFSSEQDKEVRRAMFRTLAILEDTSPAFLDKALHSDDPELRSRAILLQAGHGPGIWPWPWPWPQPRPMP
jgi:HEAT repeat protein